MEASIVVGKELGLQPREGTEIVAVEGLPVVFRGLG